jgi:hypothetical protein
MKLESRQSEQNLKFISSTFHIPKLSRPCLRLTDPVLSRLLNHAFLTELISFLSALDALLT